MNRFLLITCCALLTWFTTIGQSKKDTELRDQFWASPNEQINTTEVPDNWKGESAVVLYKNVFYGYTNNGKKMYNPSYKHYRIKLLDQAAIENYSSLSFDEDQKISFFFSNLSKEKTTVGIKVVKPDGSENIVDVDEEAISQDSQKKIAIPGLEIGDILDFFVYEDDYQRSFSGTHIYDPVETVLSQNDPILFSRLAIEVENDYFLNMESYNGAPEIKEEDTEKRATRRYVLEAENLEKTKFPRWSYPLVELPTVKFQVTFALKARNEVAASVFLGDEDAERKSKVSKSEILEFYEGRFTAYKKTIKDAVRYVEATGTKDPRQQFEEAFYYARHKYFNKFIELYIAREELGLGGYACDGEYFNLTQSNFTNFMSGLAREFEIDYDVVVATAGFNGSIDELLLKSNVSYGIRLNFSKPLYVFELSPHAQLNRFPEYLEGTKAYIIAVKKGRQLQNVSTATLPVSLASSNVQNETAQITIDDNFEGFKVERNSIYTGYFKPENLTTQVFFSDYLDEEYKRYDTDHYYFCGKRQSKNEKSLEERTLAAYQTFRDSRIEFLEEQLSASLDAPVSDYTYEVKQTSRYDNKPLIINDAFTLKDNYIKKAGPNYIVSVGKFIGGQVQLEKDEYERTENVHIDYAKTFNYEVRLNIPQGYTVVGLDKLQRDVQNDTGSFKSSASIDDGVLIFNTSKVYKKRTYTPEEWSEMTQWLETAYDFSQEKVLFKKI